MNYINSLMDDVRFVEDKYPNYDVLGAFLYGSQNYNLDTENSDVDSIVVIIQSIKSLLYEKEVRTTYEMADHHIVVKDLKAFNKNLLTLSPTAVEPLFAQLKWINDKYKYIYQKFYHDNAQKIAMSCPVILYDKVRAMIKSMARKESLTGKQYVLCKRMIRLLQKLAEGKSYEEAMWFSDDEAVLMIDIKRSDKVFSGTDLTLLECESTNPILVKYFTENNIDDREHWREYLAEAAACMVKIKEFI